MTTSLSLIQKPCQKIPGQMETEHLSDMDIGKELNIISWASKSTLEIFPSFPKQCGSFENLP